MTMCFEYNYKGPLHEDCAISNRQGGRCGNRGIIVSAPNRLPHLKSRWSKRAGLHVLHYDASLLPASSLPYGYGHPYTT
ncbi:hypothetical protein M404DRAFT_1000442 [Pisolithus tinctorius Marx 270]|uniref:Uncharacterized protein n=1 Tax=Pisolithus tinctorius Marx 270 TaxID=870435 RepID=A0A0C3PAF0_PISTI|nr:hypothetical protein M404DRAFT_1000442 [Pisolithus tinctorius Marx 270]